MNSSIFTSGSRIRVTDYSPFRGLKGTILRSDTISSDQSEPFYWYFVALDGTTRREPIWLEDTEVELIEAPALDSLAQPALGAV